MIYNKPRFKAGGLMTNRQTIKFYLLGVLIGFLMVHLFLFGYRVIFTVDDFLGSAMVISGLVLWPLYIVIMLVYSMLKRNTLAHTTRKAMLRSIYIVPLGSIIAVLLIPIYYLMFNV